MIKFLFSLLLVLSATNVLAKDIGFSWLANEEDYLSGYIVYCDLESNADRGDRQHQLRKWRGTNNEVQGRIVLDWKGFPSETYYCVVVARCDSCDGLDYCTTTCSNGLSSRPLSSPFSEEVVVYSIDDGFRRISSPTDFNVIWR